jgi:hypothetical protein
MQDVRIITLSSITHAEGPLGSSPIQLSFGSGGIKVQKEPGYICGLDASLGEDIIRNGAKLKKTLGHS